MFFIFSKLLSFLIKPTFWILALMIVGILNNKKRNISKEKNKNNFLFLLFKTPAIIKAKIQNVGLIKNDSSLEKMKNI